MKEYGQEIYKDMDNDQSLTVETTPRGLKIEILTRDEDTDGILMGDSYLMEAENVLDLFTALRQWIGEYANRHSDDSPLGLLYRQAYYVAPEKALAVWDSFFFSDADADQLRKGLAEVVKGACQ